ncbi:hypothetical protein HS7_15120 [Sulfolobales archaeon HS-7]|nr:hypothetical protein HS7_15120 [Sulfolobales archaeon HS-7]
MAVKNEEPVIGKVMEKVVQQVDSHHELVIVEGYSKDKTLEIINSHSSPKVMRLRGGRRKARELALRNSR